MDLNITIENRDKIINKIAELLDTRDKRFMFLKLESPRLVSKIQLEASANDAAWFIYDEFSKQGMIGSLVTSLNVKLDTNLTL